ncbi:MAG TPA: PaaI family thioesterase [Pyrinomonadaceae bacterium]|nr:PaaI family thioesterase [Pyrinomonadaceae bacterium]
MSSTGRELTEAQRQRVERALDSVPFAKLLGIQFESAVAGRAVLTLPIRDEHTQNHGVVHGGAIASLIDSAMAFAIIPLLAEDERTTTVDLTIHYLRPLSEGVAKSTARVVRAGRRVIVVSAEVVDHDDRLIATAVSTYLRLTADAD